MFALKERLRTEADAVQFLQEKGIIPQTKECDRCARQMNISVVRNKWRCTRKDCRKEVLIKKGTYLQGSKLSYTKFILFVYCWSKEYTTVKFCQDELDMKSCQTAVDYNNYMREICAFSILKHPMKIGGPNMTVEIDETLVSRRKFNVGRVRPAQWVFGGVCRETEECFLYAVPDRTTETLNSCITNCIEPQTTIVSDCWRAYGGIDGLIQQYRHLTVNHRYNFTDPETGANTNMIEGLWSLAKAKFKRMYGVRQTMLDGYLCEFMWRRRNRNRDLFETILQDIAEFTQEEI